MADVVLAHLTAIILLKRGAMLVCGFIKSYSITQQNNPRITMSATTDYFTTLPTNIKLDIIKARLDAAKAAHPIIPKAGENFTEVDVDASKKELAKVIAERDALVNEVLVEADSQSHRLQAVCLDLPVLHPDFLGLNFGSIAKTIGKVAGGIAGAAGKAISIANKIGPIVQKVGQAKGLLETITGALAQSSNLVEDEQQTKEILATAQKAEDLKVALARVEGSLKVLDEHKAALTAESFTEDEPEAENFLPFLGTVFEIVKTLV
ncbi:hypothetical protein NLJ89_g3867 [Agrocybe chaxingu]|uniref:Uncharacterized protein n=1 Tax=Agrocybe chaxingu TaxID=84603 RepID=A0A9W8K4E9_9AGAR|nr:hypothetical protein NLJ89_g3867 [Agrocybe chaxingu]